MANATETQIVHYRAICIEKFGAQEAFGKLERNVELLIRCMLKGLERFNLSRRAQNLVLQLRNSHRTIEAWRLLNKLIAISKQHHGPEHKITQGLENKLLLLKTA
jgi:hypothetical protein